MSGYGSALKSAIDVTYSMGFEAPEFPADWPPLLTDELVGRIYAEMTESLDGRELSIEEIGLKCAPVHFALKPAIDKAIGTATLLTLGAVQYGDDVFFSPNSLDVDELAHSGNYHVWLTLPSCEVIDLTLTSALFLKKCLSSSAAGRPIIMHADANPQMRWAPLLVGDDMVQQLLSRFS